MKPSSLFFPIALVFYEIVVYLSNDMYLSALPQMMKDLDLSLSQAQLTLTTWFIGSAIMPLVAGPLADRFGRRPVLLIGGLIYILGTIFCAFSNQFYVLLIGRFIEGGMVPFMLVPGYACIHEIYEQKQAIRMLALMGSISVLAPALGPFLGSLVLLIGPWRAIFWCIAIAAVVMLLILFKRMPETLTKENQQALHISALGNRYGRVLSNPPFMLLMFVLGFMFAGFLSWITAGSLLVMSTFQYTAVQFGLIQAGIFIVYIFGNRMIKVLLDRLGVYKLIYLGLGLALTFTLIMIISAFIFPQGLGWFLVSMALFGFGSSLAFSPLERLIIEASKEPMGIRMAIFSVCLSGSAALGSAIASLYFDGSIASLATLITISMIISFSLMMFYKRKFLSV